MNTKLMLETARERVKNAKAVASTDDLTLAMEEVVGILEVLLERKPTMFTVRVGRAGQVVIPQTLREKYKIEIGQEITLDLWLVGGGSVQGDEE